MANISLTDVSKAYGGRKLFEDVTVSFTEARRFGITGPNGAGKSTLMKIISGEVEPDEGRVSRPKRTSVLSQDQFSFENDRVLDVVVMGSKALWAALQEKEELLKVEDLSDEQGMRLGELEMVVAEEDGYTAQSDAAELLAGLGIEQGEHDLKMSELAAGRRMRVLLAQALFGRPEALLLDEPTNNLDLDSIRWLESFLCEYDGVLLVVSHDRHFINTVCTHIADIDYEAIITYTGGYDDMVMVKGQIRNRVEQDQSEKQKKIVQLQEFVSRFSAGTRASQVKSRQKQITKLEVSDLKRSNIARPFIRFEQKEPSGKRAIDFADVSKQWPNLVVCDEFDALVMRGEKIAIIGKSGTGKSTLVKMLVEEIRPDHGKIERGHQVSVGYLPQQHRETIPEGMTIAHYLHGFDEKAKKEQIRAVLGQMLFRGEDGEKKTEVLSGGEAVRLIFSRLMLTRENVLVLDDPTNHLDLESILALGDALSKYPGTAFVVTHDQDLISTFATRLFVCTERGLMDFPGTWEEYLEKYGEDEEGPLAAAGY